MRARYSSMVVLALACVLTQAIVSADPMGTAFTYQGKLEDAGGPITDSCAFGFRLWDDPTGGAIVGPTVGVSGWVVEVKLGCAVEVG